MSFCVIGTLVYLRKFGTISLPHPKIHLTQCCVKGHWNCLLLINSISFLTKLLHITKGNYSTLPNYANLFHMNCDQVDLEKLQYEVDRHRPSNIFRVFSVKALVKKNKLKCSWWFLICSGCLKKIIVVLLFISGKFLFNYLILTQPNPFESQHSQLHSADK